MYLFKILFYFKISKILCSMYPYILQLLHSIHCGLIYLFNLWSTRAPSFFNVITQFCYVIFVLTINIPTSFSPQFKSYHPIIAGIKCTWCYTYLLCISSIYQNLIINEIIDKLIHLCSTSTQRYRLVSSLLLDDNFINK